MNFKKLFTRKSNPVQTDYFDNGKVEKLYYLNRNKKIHGQYVQYFETGSVKIRASYKNGVLDGVYKKYFENVLFDTRYTNKMLNRGQNELIEACYLKIKTNYIKGKLNGSYKEYLLNNISYIESNYLNNELHGQYTEYFPSNQVKINATYINGKLDGQYTEYDIKGEEIADEFYIQGKKITDIDINFQNNIIVNNFLQDNKTPNRS